MLRTDGGGQEADPAPHKTGSNFEEGNPMPATPAKADPLKADHSEPEQAGTEVTPKPTPAKSSDAGFGSFG